MGLEWDGTQWQQWLPTPGAAPRPVRGSWSMAHERAASRNVLVTSQSINDAIVEEVWSFDGAAWTRLLTGRGWGPVQLTYDERRERIVAFDGKALREWTSRPAAVAQLGSGCGAPVPDLSARTVPRPGEPAFGFEVEAGAPGRAVIWVVGLSAAPVTFGSCTVEVGAPSVTRLLLAGGAGIATLPVPLPWSPALVGLDVFAQAAVLDPAANTARLSRALALTLGD